MGGSASSEDLDVGRGVPHADTDSGAASSSAAPASAAADLGTSEAVDRPRQLIAFPGNLSRQEKKRLRDRWRSKEFREEGVVRTSLRSGAVLVPPPPICERANAKWEEYGGKPCRCNEWPAWLEATRGQGLWNSVADCPAGDNEGFLRRGPASMWRPSGGKQGWWWYNGLIADIYQVRFPSGVLEHVIQTN